MVGDHSSLKDTFPKYFTLTIPSNLEITAIKL